MHVSSLNCFQVICVKTKPGKKLENHSNRKGIKNRAKILLKCVSTDFSGN